MSLVDYESSGEENEGESELEMENKEFFNKSSQKVNINISCENNANSNVFSSLPTPKVNVSLLTDNNKLNNILLNKSINLVRQKNDKGVKISVPSVNDFDDNDQPAIKKRKPSVKGVGLFSILPPPKNLPSKESMKTFIPHSIKKTLNKPNSKVSVKIETVAGMPSAINKNDEEDDDDDDEALVGSFFGNSLITSSLCLESPTKDETIDTINVTTTSIKEKMKSPNQSPHWIAPYPKHNGIEVEFLDKEENSNLSGENSESGKEIIDHETNPLALDEKALQILCGNKKKRQQMSMNIIDLSGEEIMPDSKEWLLKQLSQEKRGKSKGLRRHDGPSSQSRRKHQITYLAFQAKEQELELQNQWANNRMSRRQTQSKYGF